MPQDSQAIFPTTVLLMSTKEKTFVQKDRRSCPSHRRLGRWEN